MNGNLIKILSIFLLIIILVKLDFNFLLSTLYIYADDLHNSTISNREAAEILSGNLKRILDSEYVTIIVQNDEGSTIVVKSFLELRGTYRHEIGTSTTTLIPLPKTILDDPMFTKIPIARNIFYFILDYAYDSMLFFIRFLIV